MTDTTEPYLRDVRYMVRIDDEDWVVSWDGSWDEDHLIVRETRCNGQEDCHAIEHLTKTEAGWAYVESQYGYPNSISDGWGADVAAELIAHINRHGPPPRSVT